MQLKRGKHQIKISLITHNITKNNGQGIVNLELTKFLAKKGYEIETIGIKFEKELYYNRNVIVKKVKIPFLRPHLIKEIFFTIITDFSIMLKGTSSDALIANGGNTFLMHDFNYVHFCHSAFMKELRKLKEPPIKKIYHLIYTFLNSLWEKFVFKYRAKHLIAVSNKVKEEITNYIGIPREKIDVIHNGANTEEFYPANKKDKSIFERFADIEGDDFLLLYAGDTKRDIKGLGILIDTLKVINNPKIKLLVAGSLKGNVFIGKATSKRMKNVLFLGFRKDIAEIMRNVDIFVYPTEYDPCPLVILEAMSSGLPVITSNSALCGASELILDGYNGIILKNNKDINEIRDKIRILYKDIHFREKLSLNARKTAEKYTWQKTCARFENLCKLYCSSLTG